MASGAVMVGSFCARSRNASSALRALSRMVCAKASHGLACWSVILSWACMSAMRRSTASACFCAWSCIGDIVGAVGFCAADASCCARAGAATSARESKAGAVRWRSVVFMVVTPYAEKSRDGLVAVVVIDDARRWRGRWRAVNHRWRRLWRIRVGNDDAGGDAEQRTGDDGAGIVMMVAAIVVTVVVAIVVAIVVVIVATLVVIVTIMAMLVVAVVVLVLGQCRQRQCHAGHGDGSGDELVTQRAGWVMCHDFPSGVAVVCTEES